MVPTLHKYVVYMKQPICIAYTLYKPHVHRRSQEAMAPPNFRTFSHFVL